MGLFDLLFKYRRKPPPSSATFLGVSEATTYEVVGINGATARINGQLFGASLLGAHKYGWQGAPGLFFDSAIGGTILALGAEYTIPDREARALAEILTARLKALGRDDGGLGEHLWPLIAIAASGGFRIKGSDKKSP